MGFLMKMKVTEMKAMKSTPSWCYNDTTSGPDGGKVMRMKARTKLNGRTNLIVLI